MGRAGKATIHRHRYQQSLTGNSQHRGSKSKLPVCQLCDTGNIIYEVLSLVFLCALTYLVLAFPMVVLIICDPLCGNQAYARGA